MTAGGVIPHHTPREIGRMRDVDGVPIVFTINLDGTVRIRFDRDSSFRFGDRCADLDAEAREEFMRLFMEAERQAEAAVDG